jgi:uncharacterized protein (DUF4415 family)
MNGSKMTAMSGEQMRAAAERGESRSDWARVRAGIAQQPGAAEMDRRIGALIARRRGPGKTAARALLSLRLPQDVLMRWKASGPGWQTRMAEALRKAAP